ncbi:UvrD-helicase domain-containing protein [Oleiharenicola lentus]|uniref:UvrD-helicase domain-containing protein n=1 Tax=Oleiharenicola lentus TaxID=2508720 RepID=UPI003F66C4FE
MSASRHSMILASAGSGKTFALTNRFVRLLAEGAKPERIVALTFTRKAAGEFFDEILRKLAAASIDEEKARQLAEDIKHPALGCADFLRMLRAVTDAMPRLRLGTLDSFFARIARTFPLELGLAGDFEILQEYAARLERRRVLQRMFARAGELDAAQKEFIESFKRATFGRETKRLGAQLDEFLDRYQEIYLGARDGELWGNAERVWPEGAEWLAAKVDLPLAERALRMWMGEAGLADKQRERWEKFLQALPEWSPGAVLPREIVYVLEKVLAAWTEINSGPAQLEFDRKKQELSASACAALREIARHVVGGELNRRIEVTRGIHAVLRGYENYYHDSVRRAGKLTFGDVQRLLAPGADVPELTQGELSEGDNRLAIDYRLDGEIDHWLLDEFQDTSRGQWSVLENLVDEAVQDEAGVRSFFCVGDVKQAIFTWREGDPRLFREIFSHYNTSAPDLIAQEHLVASWRSGPPLIEMVNRVFGDKAALENLFPGAMSNAWNQEWREHSSAVEKHTGQAAWLHAEDEIARRALLLDLLREVNPLERGLSCAVLVQTNNEAAELADFLRREGGFPAVADSDLYVCTDNPVGAALLALVKAAAHPGDRLAQEHLLMTPLGAALKKASILAPEQLSERVLGQIYAEGFERTLEGWWREIEPNLAKDDAFSRLRARQIIAAARVFDETASRNVAEFIAFMERHTVRESESAAVVRVMTIHKSKGLGFDMVFLPDLEGNKLDQARDGPAVHKGGDRTVEWVLDLPPKLFWQNDATLAEHMRGAEAEAGYESLSLLYVAMTRAKRAMYVLTKQPGDSVSKNYLRVLAETLGSDSGEVRVGALKLSGGWSTGDADWHAKLAAAKPAEKPAGEIKLVAVEERRSARLLARKPSGQKKSVLRIAPLFSVETGASADFGLAVHALLAEVEWGVSASELGEAWQQRGVSDDVLNEALECVRAPALAELWEKPRGANIQLWRERAFEVVLGGDWITGVVDRVLVELDATGRPVQAVVFDFKTDRVTKKGLPQAMARHEAQLNVYRKVVGVLTGLPVNAVDAEVVFTQLRVRCRVPLEKG